ncbi:hypothetical protein [Orientia tsutsugamushi]|uniref:Uncharacterized protein n=1 Tax=Orientia tsutsugamushi TaxID=784 RepID=A0A2U3RJP1_ORITS|nr:hypothetical protein [Orientia tsutsugamushi]SPR13397.1 Uncharacterised protein [Orientia tsutsugamushi]
MNAIHLSVIIVLFGYLSIELATANSLPKGGFYGTMINMVMS